MKRILLCFFCLSRAAFGDDIDFNRDIRPILSENCFYCHGQDANKRQADLRLDLREGVLEANVIVPGNVNKSELINRIESTDADVQMPPADSNRVLSKRQKELLKRWVASGAKYQVHWAYQTITRPSLPTVEKADWVRNPIDNFVLAKLEKLGLPNSPEADRVTLIRRLSADLLGLPPTIAEVEDFVNDTDPLAYEKLVDRMLKNRHYGERLALPWLDAARYADSNGFQQDGDTWQWIWRDWVVRALNDDLPFDQFTIWQLAGDLLPNATIDQKIASGFNRNHLLNGEGGAIPEEQRFVILFDRMDTTATTWLGLTMACAQCHDHKYDPITRKDYYSLMDAFNRVPESGTPQRQSTRIRVARPFIELPTEENKRRIAEFEGQIKAAESKIKEFGDAAFAGWRAGIVADGNGSDVGGLPKELQQLLTKTEKLRSKEERAKIESELRKFYDTKVRGGLTSKRPETATIRNVRNQLNAYRGDQIPRVMVMSDSKPRQTSILDRGEYLKPTEKVSFATPGFLPPLPEKAPTNRLGLARWLVSPEHPLTARVQVNRMWQYFFGRGIVKSSEDLGVQSEYPIHKDLLDWLAVEFREKGWSMKEMHRLIVTSATYRQSSRMRADHRKIDSQNEYYARASRFRMPSMILRDWALASAGMLERKIGGKPVYPYQPDNVWEPLAITKERDFTYPASSGKDLYRRSLYTFWRRTVTPANMFDASTRQACRVRTVTTSTPLHALTTLNDPTWVEAARVLAKNSLQHHDGLKDQIIYAFRRVCCRSPNVLELDRLQVAYKRQHSLYLEDRKAAESFVAVGSSKRDKTVPVVEHAAMTAICLAILNLDEALTRE